MANIAETVLVFDLDDTLYPEVDYLDSGMRHVCNELEKLCGENHYETLLAAGKSIDWLALSCQLAGWPASSKESLLWLYRLHFPSISLSEECKNHLAWFSKNAKGVAILTDGRIVTQRLKLRALGLEEWPAYISENYGAPKPDAARFQLIEKHFPAEHFVYIGDNVAKDFYAPNALGWTSFCIRGSGDNVHSQSLEGLPSNALPTYWVDGWVELQKILIAK